MHSQTTTRTLRNLVQEFHTGAILLPQFQRDYIWKPAKIRNLLDSLLKGFPIGGFYLWRPIGGVLDPKQKALGGNRIESEFVGYLIDGQQRSTSLEAAFGLYTGEDRGAELRCYLDLKAPETERARDTRLFVSYAGNKSVARRVDAGDSTLVPVSLIFDGKDWLVNQGAKDWLNAEPIDLLARSGSLSFPGGDLTVHHIFPRRILADIDDNPNYANCPANYALLSRATNAEFGSKPPDEVLASLLAEQRKFGSVQFFGEAAGDRLKNRSVRGVLSVACGSACRVNQRLVRNRLRTRTIWQTPRYDGERCATGIFSILSKGFVPFAISFTA